jgi:hypothetical protein
MLANCEKFIRIAWTLQRALSWSGIIKPKLMLHIEENKSARAKYIISRYEKVRSFLHVIPKIIINEHPKILNEAQIV